jgi:hypothetical protein
VIAESGNEGLLELKKASTETIKINTMLESSILNVLSPFPQSKSKNLQEVYLAAYLIRLSFE